MKLRKINSHNETIEFLVFNYDGQGSALVIENNDGVIESKSVNEVKEILLGGIGKDKEYELAQ
jgi:hypothetical protein